MIRYGTHHFVTADAARRYYKGQGDADCFGPGWIKRIDEKIQAGEIAIGKPPLPPGAKLIIIDNGTRYAIEEPKVKIATLENATSKEPAFPSRIDIADGGTVFCTGITKREWYAGQALPAIVSAITTTPERAAEHAFKYADAMVAAGKKGGAA